MNDKAALLGMADTVFTNASGLASSTQRTTVSDMIKLCQYASNNAVPNGIWDKKTYTHKHYTNNVTLILLIQMKCFRRICDWWQDRNSDANVYNLMTYAEIKGRKFFGVVLGSLT